MADYKEIKRNPKEGLSMRQLLLLFMAGVAVCAVFFALGFVVGYNQRPSLYTAATERITGTSSVIPPAVNPPLEKDQPPSSSPESSSSEPPTEIVSGKPAQASNSPAEPASSVPEAAAKAQAGAGSGILLQVAASSSQKDAKNLVSALRARGYPAFLVTPQDAHSADNLFRVQVGPFSTREDADTARKRLSDEGFHPFLRR